MGNGWEVPKKIGAPATAPSQLDRIEAALERIEQQNTLLLALLVDEDGEQPVMTLDGQPAGEERIPGTPL